MRADTLEEAVPGREPGRLSISVIVLVLANLVPVYGVLAHGWDVFPIVLLFWLENIVVGVLNVFRMAVAEPPDGTPGAAKAFLIPFFCVHYGIFTVVHGVFVFALFSGAVSGEPAESGSLAGAAEEAFSFWSLGLPLLLLAGSHVFSFVWNYLLGGEYRRTTLQTLMFRPYGRIVVLHVTIIFGGFLAMSLGSPVWALLLLIALKIGLDVTGHIRSHRKVAETVNPA